MLGLPAGEGRFSTLPGESGSVAELLQLEPNEGLAQAGSSETKDVTALTAAFHFTGSTASASGATSQEYFVQSIVSTAQQHELLFTRLRGLSQSWTEFCDQETAYHLGDTEVSGVRDPSASVSTAAGGAGGLSKSVVANSTAAVEPGCLTSGLVSVRLRRSLLQPASAGDRPLALLRYLGSVETNKGISRRSSLEVPVAGPSVFFLRELGFQRDFTFVAEGHLFVRGRVKVLIYTVNNVTKYQNCLTPDPVDPANQESLAKEWSSVCPRNWLVEISAIGSPSDDSLQDEVSEFVDLLYPLVTPMAVDYSALLHK